MAKDEKPKQKIEIDEDYFTSLNKVISGIAKELGDLTQLFRDNTLNKPTPSTLIVEGGKGVFFSVELSLTPIKTPEEAKELQDKIMEFRKELEALMTKFKIPSVNAMFLHQI